MPRKQYPGDFATYEKKLSAAMERLGVIKYSYDWNQSRSGVSYFVESVHGGKVYRFENDVKRAADAGKGLTLPSDLFAAVVVTLEDIAHAAEQGILSFETPMMGVPVVVPGESLYNCSVSWLLGNEASSPFGPEVTDRKLMRSRHPFSVCPTHVIELCRAVGISERCLAADTGFPESILQKHHMFPSIEVSEPVFQAMYEALGCTPAELREFPAYDGSAASIVEQDVDRILCGKIMKAMKASNASVKAFQASLGLAPEDWPRVEEGTMKFSKDAIKALQSKMKISLVLRP